MIETAAVKMEETTESKKLQLLWIVIKQKLLEKATMPKQYKCKLQK